VAINQIEAQEPKDRLIINIGSNTSFKGISSGAAYTVSKAGIVGLMKNTAGFYGPRGIYCSALMLGCNGGHQRRRGDDDGRPPTCT
jgi:NAD(P)-dependent dehydrogenase (short-subunit alcohol dehydrogenase family)